MDDVDRAGHAGDHHHHDADHDPRHVHGREGRDASAGANQRRLALVMGVGALLLVFELVGGLLANSLVLLSDAAHTFTDVGAVALAWVAVRLSLRPPDERRSFGYHRAEILAAFLNALFLWGISAYLLFEAWQRIRSPPTVDGGIVTVVGAGAFVLTVGLAALLHSGSGHNLNVRSAYMHLLSDAVGSAAAVVAGVTIQLFGWYWMDPATTILVALLIIAWTWRLTRETLHILLEGTPARISADEVKRSIQDVEGVLNVHDLHVWSLTTGVDNLSVHILVGDVQDGPRIVGDIRRELVRRYRLQHVTIEVETRDSACVGCN